MAGFLGFWRKLPPTARGIVLICASTVFYASSHGMIRHIATDISALQISFIHNVVGLLLFTPWFLRYGFGGMRTARFPMHLLRSALNVCAMFAFFTALTVAPLAKVTALFFTSPIFAALLAVTFLGERMRLRRWSALGFGFLGTLIILRPGLVAIDTGTVLTLASALLWASAMIVIRRLGTTENTFTQTAYTSALMAAFSAPPAVFVWTWPSANTWGWLIAISTLGTCAHLSVAQGLREAEASVIAPFDFLKLIWISIIAYLAFSETPDVFIWTGAVIVIASTSYLAYREARARD
jgi:drug/metabolite transporter (DMT)-like permease